MKKFSSLNLPSNLWSNMGDKEIVFNLPVDSDGYVELQCSHCEVRFRLANKVLQNVIIDKIFCPACGIPSNARSVLTQELVENIQAKILNYAKEQLAAAFSQLKSNKYIKFNQSPTIYEEEHAVNPQENSMVIVLCKDCINYIKQQYI